MRNEPLRDMWRQNLWAYSRYVKRVLDMDSCQIELRAKRAFRSVGHDYLYIIKKSTHHRYQSFSRH